MRRAAGCGERRDVPSALDVRDLPPELCEALCACVARARRAPCIDEAPADEVAVLCAHVCLAADRRVQRDGRGRRGVCARCRCGARGVCICVCICVCVRARAALLHELRAGLVKDKDDAVDEHLAHIVPAAHRVLFGRACTRGRVRGRARGPRVRLVHGGIDERHALGRAALDPVVCGRAGRRSAYKRRVVVHGGVGRPPL